MQLGSMNHCNVWPSSLFECRCCDHPVILASSNVVTIADGAAGVVLSRRLSGAAFHARHLWIRADGVSPPLGRFELLMDGTHIDEFTGPLPVGRERAQETIDLDTIFAPFSQIETRVTVSNGLGNAESHFHVLTGFLKPKARGR